MTTYTAHNIKTKALVSGLLVPETQSKVKPNCGALTLRKILANRGVFIQGDWIVWEDGKMPNCQGIVDLFYNDHIPSWAADYLIDLTDESPAIKKQSHDFISDAYGP